MSKHFTHRGLMAAAMMAASMAATAQSMTQMAAPTVDDVTYQLMAKAISPNHRYIAGQAVNYDQYAYAMFVYDTQEDRFAIARETGWMGSSLSAVGDDGVAVGYDATAITMSIDGTQTELAAPEGTTGRARDISDDGTTIVGYYMNNMDFTSHACVWVGGECAALPEPTAEELGHDVYGTEAHFVSADGATVVGIVVDYISTGSMCVWQRQADGSYAIDVVSKNYVNDGTHVDQGHIYVQFAPTGLSSNGQYVALTVSQVGNDVQKLARYDMTTGALEECTLDGQGSIDASAAMNSGAIANDGTMLCTSFVGNSMYQKSAACLWRAGESQPITIASLGEGMADMATLDDNGGNYVMDITPDGTHITGYAYDQSYNYVSYIANIKGEVVGIETTQANNANTAEIARYTMDGRRIDAPQKGINIVRRANGTVVKLVVKP